MLIKYLHFFCNLDSYNYKFHSVDVVLDVFCRKMYKIKVHLCGRWLPGYPDRLGPSGKFVENSTKLSCLEIIGYRIKHVTVLRLLELQIRRNRKVYAHVRTAELQTANVAHFQRKNQLSGFSAYRDGTWHTVLMNPDK